MLVFCVFYENRGFYDRLHVLSLNCFSSGFWESSLEIEHLKKPSKLKKSSVKMKFFKIFPNSDLVLLFLAFKGRFKLLCSIINATLGHFVALQFESLDSKLGKTLHTLPPHSTTNSPLKNYETQTIHFQLNLFITHMTRYDSHLSALHITWKSF